MVAPAEDRKARSTIQIFGDGDHRRPDAPAGVPVAAQADPGPDYRLG
nr:hypothetical protein [Nitrosomonas sp.]